MIKIISIHHGPLVRYVKLRVTHAPGMSGTFSPPPRVSDPDMHHGTCVTPGSLTFSPPPRVSDPDMHHGTCVTPGSLTCGFLWSQWRGKRSRHSRRMRNRQFYISGKRPMQMCVQPYYVVLNNKYFTLLILEATKLHDCWPNCVVNQQ